MNNYKCVRCGTTSSIFWWRHSLGCDSEGNQGSPYVICDDCQIELVKFLQGCSLESGLVTRRYRK